MELEIPRHISIIMDGNGRWARKQGKRRLFGHTAAVEAVRDTITYAAQIGVQYLSLFAFSEENWGRPDAEVQTLMELMGRAMLGELDNFMAHDVRFMVLSKAARYAGCRSRIISRAASRSSLWWAWTYWL